LPAAFRQNKERTMLRVNYWEIIADNLSKAGWSWGCVSAIDSNGRTIWIADAHRDDGKRFVVQRNPTELRRSILDFLGADPDKSGSQVPADYNSWARKEKLPLTDKVRSHLAQFFKKELKICAARLGGAARRWPGRYGFSLLLFFWDLLDDSIDLLFRCDWIC